MTSVYRMRAWAAKRGGQLVFGVVAAIAIVAVVVAMRNARASAETSAATQLSQAQYYLWGDNLTQAIDLAGQVISRWPGTRSAHIARLVQADALLRSDRPREALDAYQAFLAQEKGKGLLQAVAWRGEAVALEEVGQFADASERYERLAREHDSGTLVASDLMAAARCRERAGDADGARRLYQELLDDHPDAQVSFDARLKLKELGVARSGQG